MLNQRFVAIAVRRIGIPFAFALSIGASGPAGADDGELLPGHHRSRFWGRRDNVHGHSLHQCIQESAASVTTDASWKMPL